MAFENAFRPPAARRIDARAAYPGVLHRRVAIASVVRFDGWTARAPSATIHFRFPRMSPRRRLRCTT